jgi:hypothetical protein
MTELVRCEICGFLGSGVTVFQRLDGITRCRVCAYRSYDLSLPFVDETIAWELEDRGVRPEWMDPDDPCRVKEG